MGLSFGVLGPVWAQDERGRLALKGPRHRAVLARLLVARGRVVPVGRLIDDLWERPPDDAVGALQTFVAALRKVLEPDRRPRQPASVLVTVAPGYALRVEPDQVDALRFEAHIDRAGRFLAAGDGAAALRETDAALALWQGPPYAEFTETGWARGEIARLTELRMRAVEQRAEAMLRTGRAADAVIALEAHLQELPLREHAWQLFALALYRAGRQADALAALRTVRDRLRNELGVDPGPELRAVEADILAQSERLDMPTISVVGSTAPPVAPATPASGPTRPADTTAAASDSASSAAGPLRGNSTAPPVDTGRPATDTRRAREPSAAASAPVPRLVSPSSIVPRTSTVPVGGATPPGSSTTPPVSSATPPVGGATPPGSSATPPGGSTTPPVSGATPPVSGATPPVGGATPPGGSTTPPGGSTTPPGGSTTPPASGATPPVGGATPPVGGATPPVGGDVLSNADALRTSESVVSERVFVGRANELAQMFATAEACAGGFRSGLVLVAGGEGAGKTALAEAFSVELARRGWTVAWGPSPAGDGVPPDWSWTRIVADLAAAGYRIEPSALAGDGDAAVRRFELHRSAAEQLSSIARRTPLLVVFDDLHQAGPDTLELLTALATAAVHAPLLFVATYRTSDIGTGLTAALSRLARVEPARVYLGGLAEADTAELIGAVLGGRPPVPVVRRIQVRSNGNPFFIRELARLFLDEGSLASVPAGVRDVVRHRLSRLDERHRTVLRQAAVLGGDIDRELLAALTGDAALALDGLEAGLRAGFLHETPSARISFEHDVVRDVLYEDISGPRRAVWHERAADLLERSGNADPAVLAHHLLCAGTRAAARRAVGYARTAALTAERMFAPHDAVRLWRMTLRAYDNTAQPESARGTGDTPERLDAMMGLVRALAITGDLRAARELRAQALSAVEPLGDPKLTARVLTAFDIPALWTTNDDEALARRIVRVADETLAALPAGDTELRARLLTTVALEVRATDGARGRAAADEAERIAARLGDPRLLAFARNGRFMQTFHRTGLAAERAEIATGLIDLARANELVSFEVLGHLIAVQSRCALADFAAAARHAAAAAALGERYDLPLVDVFTEWYSALRQSLSVDAAAAEAAYRTAAAHLPGAAMPGLEAGLLPLALTCVRLRHGLPIALDHTDFGTHAPWVEPLLLLEHGYPDNARKALRALPEPPGDLLTELRYALMTRAALSLGEHTVLDRAYTALLPASAELAGATTGLVTLEPVAHYLSEIATARGDHDAAAHHRAQARRLTDSIAQDSTVE
ncbi:MULTISPECIES: BTAD domain-containing putative transcriptional regulator [unclassified Nocardia]|uniref:BTAD domain-containing putative transcriptional regulator n=1 Tax=unclassified Nocardia TaxID=2637762 RepID=UPI002105F0B2|nr:MULTISPECIES: BTAD domain-containing putative transcriptional regulator [unclassified Nocardia]